MLATLLALVETEEQRKLFTDLYLKYRTTLLQMASNYLYHQNEAADCVQDTFLVLIQRFDTFIQLTEEKQKRYLLTICKRCAIRLNGKHRQLPQDYYERLLQVKREEARQAARQFELADALDKLDELNLQILFMKYLEGYSVKEISDTLGLSEKAVKQRLYRMRKTLRMELEPDGGADNGH